MSDKKDSKTKANAPADKAGKSPQKPEAKADETNKVAAGENKGEGKKQNQNAAPKKNDVKYVAKDEESKEEVKGEDDAQKKN